MKLIILLLLICSLVQAGFFALRDAASRNVSAFDRCAELALLLMMIVTLFLFSRHPRPSLLIYAVCSLVIGLNLEHHTNDHSISGITARNLLTIVFFIVAAIGAPSLKADGQTS